MQLIMVTVFAAGAALTDLAKGKIYNMYLLPGLLTGLLLRAFTEGWQSLLYGLLSVLLAMLALIPVYMIRGIGAGDVKLLACAAAFLAIPELIRFIALSFVLAAAAGVIRLLVKRTLHGTIHFAVPVFFSALAMTGGVI